MNWHVDKLEELIELTEYQKALDFMIRHKNALICSEYNSDQYLLDQLFLYIKLENSNEATKIYKTIIAKNLAMSEDLQFDYYTLINTYGTIEEFCDVVYRAGITPVEINEYFDMRLTYIELEKLKWRDFDEYYKILGIVKQAKTKLKKDLTEINRLYEEATSIKNDNDVVESINNIQEEINNIKLRLTALEEN